MSLCAVGWVFVCMRERTPSESETFGQTGLRGRQSVPMGVYWMSIAHAIM